MARSQVLFQNRYCTCNAAEGEKAVGEAPRDPQLAFAFGTQFGADPGAKSGRALSDADNMS